MEGFFGPWYWAAVVTIPTSMCRYVVSVRRLWTWTFLEPRSPVARRLWLRRNLRRLLRTTNTHRPNTSGLHGSQIHYSRYCDKTTGVPNGSKLPWGRGSSRKLAVCGGLLGVSGQHRRQHLRAVGVCSVAYLDLVLCSLLVFRFPNHKPQTTNIPRLKMKCLPKGIPMQWIRWV